jgi:hypothetical protein
MLVREDTQQFKDSFDINMVALVLLEAVKEIVTDSITLTLVKTLPSTMCRSCASLKRLA